MRINYLTAYHMAIELVKRAGFQFAFSAMKTESCYYFHPGRGRNYLLRLSAHKSKHSPIGLNNVCARVSFPPKCLVFTKKSVYNAVALAIGTYFLEDPPPSKYQGKRCDWDKREVLTDPECS